MVTRVEAEKEALELAGFNKKEIVLMTKFSPVPFAEEILKSVPIKYSKEKILWRYDSKEGIWKNNAEQYLKTLIRNSLLGDEQQKKNYVEEIIAHIKDTTYDEDFEVDSNPYTIGFNNGVFDLKDGKIKEFSKEYRLTNKLNIDIDENITECPTIDKFFADCVGEEYKSILYDLIAYCLFRRYPYPKLFFIYGPANTGKSKFLELLEKFLGKDNYCSVEPQDIQKDIHATAQMQFKLANIVSDINYDAMDNINQVKKITGEDTIKVRNMYREPYNTKIFAKQIFSTNKLPIVKEKTRAWYRRVYTIEFGNIVQNDKIDRFLMEKLTKKEELMGLGWKCLQYLKELSENHFTFTYDINEKEMQIIYELLSNPILMFIDENCERNSSKFLYQYEFKDRFKTWLQANHFPPVSNSEINEYMNENFVNSNRKSFNGDKTYRVWSGLGWKDLSNPDSFNHFNHFNQVGKKLYIYRKCFKEVVNSVKLVKSDEQSSQNNQITKHLNTYKH
jgi:putative DNA primase/helicase